MKVIRLTESDVENLVKKILKEEETVSSSDLGQKTKSVGQELKKGGLAPKERETLDQAIQMLTAFFKQPGNQATGKAYNLFNKLKKELETVKPEEGDVQESTINEIGGYDSPELGRSHGQSTMESIRDTYEVIVDSVEHLNSLKYDILDNRLSRATKKLLSVVSPALNEYSKVWIDAEKRRQGGLR